MIGTPLAFARRISATPPALDRCTMCTRHLVTAAASMQAAIAPVSASAGRESTNAA